MVIIVSLLIAVLCSALIVTAYFYKLQYQRKLRYDLLANNLNSATNILLESGGPDNNSRRTISLFNGDADSVSMQVLPWGIYSIGIAKAFIQRDTLLKVFSRYNFYFRFVIIESGYI